MRRRIYLASSWRNVYQPGLVLHLRGLGHEVYDFRNPEPGNNGFAWGDMDRRWQEWEPAAFRDGLSHPVAESGFALDKGGMDWADTCVLLLPSGRSAHAEAGYMAGGGKQVFVHIPEPVEPELMYKLFTGISVRVSELEQLLGSAVPA